MKTWLVFLVIFLSFSNGRDFMPHDSRDSTSSYSSSSTTISTTTTRSPTADVSINVTWMFTAETNITSVVMIVKNLKTAQWAAIGLGQKKKMGEAHVFICKRLSNDTIVLNRYINPAKHADPEPAGSEQGGVLTPGEQTFTDGVVTCRFSLSNFTTSNTSRPHDLNPLSPSRSYYPLFAVGLLYSDGEPLQHSSDSCTALSDLAQLNQNKTILYRVSNPDLDNSLKYYQIHGIIMIFAWIFFASTGILIARYFQESWENLILCGDAGWFAAHRFILSIATILTTLGFLFIFVATKGTWVESGAAKKHFAHSITGIIVITFAFFQPFIALFRCKQSSPYRYIYIYLHGLVGFAAFALSIATLFLATYFHLFKDNRARIAMIIWIVWIVFIFITFEIIGRYFQEARDAFRYSNINASNRTLDEIVDGISTENVTIRVDSNGHEWNTGHKIKNVLLVLHVFFALMLSIFLSVLIG